MSQVVVGSCTPDACGALCCTRLVVPLPTPDAWRVSARNGHPGVIVPMPKWLRADQRAFYKARGLSFLVPPVAGGGEVAFVPTTLSSRVSVIPYPTPERPALAIGSRCPHLTDENRCDLYGLPDRPRLCVDGPVAQDVPLLTDCGFEIEDVEDG